MDARHAEGDKELIIKVLLAEYAALRAEILEAIKSRIMIINFSFGGACVFIAGLLSSKIDKFVVGVILLSIVPLASKAVLLIWLGEYNRSRRAETLICRIENEINRTLGGIDAMAWVSYVHESKKSMLAPYIAAITFIAIPNYISICIGLAISIDEMLRGPKMNIVFMLLIVILIEIGFAAFSSRIWNNIRTTVWKNQ